MFNTLAQYFLGTSNNSNNLDPGSKANHQEVPTNNDHQNVEQALAQQNAFQVYPNKRGRARRNRKNKAIANANPKPTRNQAAEDLLLDNPTNTPTEELLPEDCPDFLLHGITTRICEDEDEWLFVECEQKADKKNGIISLHDDLLDVGLTCLPDGGSPVYEPAKPRFEIKHNPLNLNQQQLKRQLRQQNASLISCEDIADDEELMRANAAAAALQESNEGAEDIQVIDPQQSAVVEGNSVDVEVPPVAVELPAETETRQQQQQERRDEEPSGRRKGKGAKMAPSAPVEIKLRPGAQKMDESWFVTPPSCFTSQGPVNMETSPLENLLIEHPSMSVYHGVRSMDRSADIEESLVVLEKEREMEVKMDQQQEEETAPTTGPTVSVAAAAGVERTPVHNHDKKMRQKLCRNAMTRSNKTCEMNATKNGPKKRSEKQHAKSQSRANNNRKC